MLRLLRCASREERLETFVETFLQDEQESKDQPNGTC